MTGFPKHTERSLWPSADDVRGAESVLGREHPLARAISLEHTLAIQSFVAGIAVLLGIVGTLRHVEIGPVVLGAAFAVEFAFVAAALCARRIARDRVQDLIVDGSDGLVLPVVARESRRLASRKVRESFARSLERLLRDAQRWNEIFPPSRPLPGVRVLRHAAPEVAEVAASLRADQVRVQGVALTARLLMDGYRSPLYGGDQQLLRDELNRIRFLLDARSERPRSDTTRAAA